MIKYLDYVNEKYFSFLPIDVTQDMIENDENIEILEQSDDE